MRIISSFKDYYDKAQAYGIDPRLVYVRETREIETRDQRTNKTLHEPPMQLQKFYQRTPDALLGGTYPHGGFRYGLQFCKGVLAFCGTLYPFVIVENGRCCYDIDHLRAELIAVSATTETLAYLEGPQKKMGRGWKRHISQLEKERLHRASWTALLAGDRALDDEAHRAYASPVILYVDQVMHWPHIVINPRLNQINFQTQVDPVTAWQRLSMYVGNNLVTQKDPEVGLTDKLRRDTAGFDEWSFKKRSVKSP